MGGQERLETLETLEMLETRWPWPSAEAREPKRSVEKQAEIEEQSEGKRKKK